MELPKFLMGDNTDHKDDIFVIHTEYPRFIINLVDDEIDWLEVFKEADEDILAGEVARLIEDASAFYDREMERYQEE
ncbi:MAG: hypothetical protein BM563_07980 [Bacteroidetes bacterium MedPE-SWsnd-G1]|nr:MAG: hypothetical protein BM563_07980 [Bacteroidetes bacterium MedPE-SWsnd-G1]